MGKEGKFHCKNVKKACIYRIIAETDLTIYIVGADRGMYLPALGPSKTNASPPPTNDGVKVGNSSTVKSQEGGWWQKVAKEYKFCTLHVPCHSQVKHMRIPMASALSRGFIPTCGDGVKIPMVPALSRFPFQRLSTGYSHFIDGFPQIRQGFMGVNAFRHSRAGVSEYHLDGRFIGSCSVEHCDQRVVALIGRVVHVQLFLGVVKEAALFFLRQKNGKNLMIFYSF